MGKDECKTMLDALNKVTACYRHLVSALGSTSDSQNLREELKKTRRKAQELAAANRTRLTALLKDKNISHDDRAEYERLWVLFTSSIEILVVDMRRSLEIGQDFSHKVPTRHFIQTGMTGSTSTVAARAMSMQSMKYEADAGIDTADLKDLKDLEAEIAQLGQMMEEMEMKVQVAPWAVEAKLDAGAELKSTVSVGNSSVGVISICDEEPKDEGEGEAGVLRIFAGIIFTVVLLIAAILGYLVINL